MKTPSLLKLEVQVKPSYPIFIGEDLAVVAHVANEGKVAIISDSKVYPHYGERLKGALEQAGKQVFSHSFEAGEASKSGETYLGLLRQLINDGLDRKSAVVALGGGVVGDIAGFVAASFMRGVAFYQYPTSLLAMVDASVGGKTGINLPEGKNLVGAFWQPKAVFIDVICLRSLSETEFRQGAVEHFKHGLLADAQILEDVRQPEFHRQGDTAFLMQTIARSVKVKADIVAADETEQGVRAHLNLGHTLGHALEAASGHQLLHGDAIAYGLVFAARLAAQRGYADETKRTLDFLRWVSPKTIPVQDFNELLPFIYRDKKTIGKTLRFVLLEGIGQPFVADDIQLQELEQAWAFLKEVA